MRSMLVVIGLLALVSTFASAQASDWDDCAQERDLKLSLAGCTKVLDAGKVSGKRLATTYYYRGNVNRRLGNLDQAVKDLNHALELDPNYKHPYIDLGLVEKNRRNYDHAIAYYDRALEIDPEFAKAYYNRGNVYWYQDRYDRAVMDYDQAIDIDPDYYFPYVGRAWALYALGHDELALQNADKALELRPGDAHARNIRALVLSVLGQWQEALPELDAFIIEEHKPALVKRLQTSLVEMGYFDGPVDGEYGPKTRSALEACLKERCRLLN